MRSRTKLLCLVILGSVILLGLALAGCDRTSDLKPRLIVVHDGGRSRGISSVDRRFEGLVKALSGVVLAVDGQAPVSYTTDGIAQQFGDASRVEADFEGQVEVETALGRLAFHRVVVVYLAKGGTLVLAQQSADEAWTAYVTSDEDAVIAFWDAARTHSGLALTAVGSGQPDTTNTPTPTEVPATAVPSPTATELPAPAQVDTTTPSSTPPPVPTDPVLTDTPAVAPTDTVQTTDTRTALPSSTVVVTDTPIPEPSPSPTATPPPATEEATAEAVATPKPTATPAPVVLTWHREGPGVCDDLTIDTLGSARFGQCGDEMGSADLTAGEFSRFSIWEAELAPFEYERTYEDLNGLTIQVRFEGNGEKDVSPGERGVLLLWLTQLYNRLSRPEVTG